MTTNKTPRINPYQRLLATFKEYARNVEWRHTCFMFLYPRSSLGDGYQLTDLDQRVAAAEQLGYDVTLTSDKEGLLVRYRKKIPQLPWEVR